MPHGPVEKTTCSNCWEGKQFVFRFENGDRERTDCDNCGMPGPKPSPVIHNGTFITYYVNHNNKWVSY